MTGEHVGEALGEVGVGVEAEHGVGLGQALGQLGAVALGQAADRDDLGAGVLAASDAASRVSIESFLACSTKPQVLTTTTSGRAARVGVDQLPAAARQPAGELLGVDLVAGAAEREQGGTPRASCGHRGAYSGVGLDAAGFGRAPGYRRRQ